MKGIFDHGLIEGKIKDAIRKGELKNLPGEGKPLRIEAENPLIPPEDRMAYRMMKNLGLTSVEGQLKQEMDELKEQIRECDDDSKREALKKQFREKEIWFNILMDKRRW